MISVVGVVSASDNMTEDTIAEPTTASNEDVYAENIDSNKVVSDSTSSGNSFKDLDSLISDSNEVNLTQDYIFNPEKDTDYINGIEIKNRENLVINGNNHTINADNKCVIFKLDFSAVVLNNIIFKNSDEKAIELSNSNVESKNNVYINDLNNSRALLAYGGSSISSINDSFIDNYNKYGSSILVSDSELYVKNANFRSKYNPDWATVYVDGKSSKAYIINSTFSDISANYAPAIYLDSGECNIFNCTFKNLFANLSGGAIGIKNVNNIIVIVNSSFINVSSVKNGGAIFVDVDKEYNINARIIIENCLFDDCFSMIGGAYVQLGGKLIIEDTIFNNNGAVIEGGAVYTSFADVMIVNSTFKDNEITLDDDYYSSGGALYIDSSEFYLNNSIFTGNYAEHGEDILLYDSYYNISGSSFDGVSIHYMIKKIVNWRTIPLRKGTC